MASATKQLKPARAATTLVESETLIPSPGTVVGEYEIVGKLGEGGMGVVLEARHPVIGKRVAVKMLRPEIATQQELVERFIGEASAVNRIDHENIIDIFGFGTHHGRHYFVMEFLEGESLDERLDRVERLSIAEALPVLRGVASAIDAAHREQVIHRDLKPDNVFLASRGKRRERVKILDFGIAKLAAGSVKQTQAGIAMGTPLFMPPEQCRGEPVTSRADVYAFAGMAYRALTGQYPFEADTVPALMMMHMSAEPVPPSAHGVSRALDAPILAGLEKDPDKRPANLGELVQGLEKALTEKPGAKKPRRTAGVRKWVDKRTPASMKALGPQRSGKAPAAAANDQTVALRGAILNKKPGSVSAPTVVIGSASQRNVAPGHNGKVLAIAVCRATGKSATGATDRQVIVWSADGKRAMTLDGHGGAVEHLDFSPDGKLLASAAADRIVRVWDLEKRVCLHEFVGHEAAVSALRFCDDGKTVVTGSLDGTVRSWCVESGHGKTFHGHRGPVRCVTVAPGGTRIASGGDDRTVRLWDDSVGVRWVLRGHRRAIQVLSFRADGMALASGGYDGIVRQWDLSRDYEVAQQSALEYRGHTGGIADLDWSHDGEMIASASADGTVRVWRIDGRPCIILHGHQKRVSRVVFGRENRFVASASIDRTARLWSLEKRRCEAEVGQSSTTTWLDFSEDGRSLLSCSSPGQVVKSALPAPPKPEAVTPAAGAADDDDGLDEFGTGAWRQPAFIAVLVIALLAVAAFATGVV